MRIGELAKHTGLAQSRIRFYERIGLLTAVARHPNGYRTYSADAALLLGLIATAQHAGFSLDEIRTLLPADLGHWEPEGLLATLRRKVEEIEALEARLARSRGQITALIKDIESRPDDVDCATNARKVLSQMHVGKMDGPAKVARDGPRKARLHPMSN